VHFLKLTHLHLSVDPPRYLPLISKEAIQRARMQARATTKGRSPNVLFRLLMTLTLLRVAERISEGLKYIVFV
jgi:hypothetical protein